MHVLCMCGAFYSLSPFFSRIVVFFFLGGTRNLAMANISYLKNYGCIEGDV